MLLLTYLLNSEKCYHSANFVLSYPVTTTIKGSKDARRHKQGRHPPGKCKGKIRFNYNILVRTDRIKFVATRHVSWVKIFYMCLWPGLRPKLRLGSLQRSPYPQLDLMGPFREGRAGRGGEERKMRERKVTEGKWTEGDKEGFDFALICKNSCWGANRIGIHEINLWNV